MTENQDAWKTWQTKIAKSSQYTNPNVSQIGSGDPNFRANNTTVPEEITPPLQTQELISSAPISQMSTTSNNSNVITQNEKEITAIDVKLNNVITKKDQLKLMAVQSVGSKGNDVQIKTTQNSAYQDLVSTESELINRKSMLQEQIQTARDKIQLGGGLDSQAGQQFSAGISLDPVMDQDRVIQEVPTAPAMNPSERAEFFGKEDTLLNPKYSMEDVAQGLTQQGASYLGGSSGANSIVSTKSQFQQGMENQGMSIAGDKYTILDQAIASPVRDLQHSIEDPKEFQLAQDYGYTNMDTASSKIAKNPERFAGNVATAGIVEVGLTVGTFGIGKVANNAWKAIRTANQLKSSVVKTTPQDVNNVEKLVEQMEMGKLPPVDPKVAKEVYNKEMVPFYKDSGIPPSASKLDPAKSFFPQYTKKENKKYTGIGISLAGASSLGSLTNKKKKTGKSDNFFNLGNFKY